jgi:hypothetical protein
MVRDGKALVQACNRAYGETILQSRFNERRAFVFGIPSLGEFDEGG